MSMIEGILRILSLEMATPVPYGWFHLLWLAITAAATLFACRVSPRLKRETVQNIVLIAAIVVSVLEIYKQIVFTFGIGENGITADYLWYAFPFQFCSTPMYAGLLLGLTKRGKFHNALAAYLATYAVFAGLAVMLYPTSVFMPTIGINIQTMVCHGTMIPIGALLYGSGYVKMEHKTIFPALFLFLEAVALAAIMNEIAHVTGLLDTDVFNMFFISPYCNPSLPVYSLVQQILPFPVCLILYVLGFTVAAYCLLLIAIVFGHFQSKATRNNTERPHEATQSRLDIRLRI